MGEVGESLEEVAGRRCITFSNDACWFEDESFGENLLRNPSAVNSGQPLEVPASVGLALGNMLQEFLEPLFTSLDDLTLVNDYAGQNLYSHFLKLAQGGAGGHIANSDIV